MFNSTVLEVAIGLVFCYASVALITSSIYEAIASQLNFRSKTLFTGIQSLLNAKNNENQKLLLGIYNHALASPLGDGAAKKIEDLKNKPSYIDSKHFALALIDTIQSVSGDYVKLGHDIDAIENEQIRQLLRTMYDSSAGKIENLQTAFKNNFPKSQNRLASPSATLRRALSKHEWFAATEWNFSVHPSTSSGRTEKFSRHQIGKLFFAIS
jgi:hypothetical protein